VADFGDVRSPNRQQEIATTLKYREDELQDKLSSWYERVTEIRVRFVLREGRTTFVESVTPDGAFNIVNEGFGSNQLAFLLGQLAVAPEDSTVAIEEPEIHLHPRAQYELAKVLREAAIQEKKQLIITTHSEHILHSLLTAVAAGDLTTEDLSVNYFEKKDGVAEVRRLEVDDKGRVKGGLPGFFQAEIDQMDKYIKALSKRK
jgi:predicted ATPase